MFRYIPPYNLFERVHSAAFDFYYSQDGNKDITYGDLVRDIPEEFCEARGISKSMLDDMAAAFGFDKICISKFEFAKARERSFADDVRHVAVYNALMAFSGNYQMKQVLSSIMAGWSLRQINKQLYEWSEEYAFYHMKAIYADTFATKKLRDVIEIGYLAPPKEFDPVY